MRDPNTDDEVSILQSVMLLNLPKMILPAETGQAVSDLLTQFLWDINRAADALDRQSPKHHGYQDKH